MNRTVQTQISFPGLPQSTSVKQRKALLQTLTKDQFHALCEIILNVYKGSVPVSDYYVKKLFPFKRSIQMMTNKHKEKASGDETCYATFDAQASAFHAERETSRYCFRL